MMINKKIERRPSNRQIFLRLWWEYVQQKIIMNKKIMKRRPNSVKYSLKTLEGILTAKIAR